MNCQKTRSLLTAYALDDLNADQMARVGEHLESCEACEAELRTERDVLALLRSAFKQGSDGELSLDARRVGRILASGVDCPDQPEKRSVFNLTQSKGWLRRAAVLVLLAAFAGMFARHRFKSVGESVPLGGVDVECMSELKKCEDESDDESRAFNYDLSDGVDADGSALADPFGDDMSADIDAFAGTVSASEPKPIARPASPAPPPERGERSSASGEKSLTTSSALNGRAVQAGPKTDRAHSRTRTSGGAVAEVDARRVDDGKASKKNVFAKLGANLSLPLTGQSRRTRDASFTTEASMGKDQSLRGKQDDSEGLALEQGKKADAPAEVVKSRSAFMSGVRGLRTPSRSQFDEVTITGSPMVDDALDGGSGSVENKRVHRQGADAKAGVVRALSRRKREARRANDPGEIGPGPVSGLRGESAKPDDDDVGLVFHGGFAFREAGLWEEKEKEEAQRPEKPVVKGLKDTRKAKQTHERDDNMTIVPPPPTFNAFVSATVNAVSTFAIDVDTASYTLVRNALLAGRLPEPGNVRVEEVVNFFDYQDEPPMAGCFAIHVEGAPTPFGHGLRAVRVGVKGRRLGREEQRPAVLTFLVDTSGSMERPDRIGLVKRSLNMLLEQLGPNDRVAIVQYGSKARILLEHTTVSRKVQIKRALTAMQCSGSTNLEAGMKRAYAVATAGFVPGAENRVLLMSDGVANLGSREAAEIHEKVSASKDQGISCSVFGVGRGNYDDEMLEQLADKGDGAYRYLDSLEEARRVFVDDLAATLNTIAFDVKIQVVFNPKAVAQYRQLGYENRQLTKEQFRDDSVDAGEVGSGQSVTALYELKPAAGWQAGASLFVVSVRYRDAGTGGIREIEKPVTVSMLETRFVKTRPRFRLAVCAAEFAELLRGSPHTAGSSMNDVARILRPIALQLNLDTRISELLRLVEQAGRAGK